MQPVYGHREPDDVLMCRLGEKHLIETALRELGSAQGIAPNGQLLRGNGKIEL